MNVNAHADGSENLKTPNEGGVVNTLTKGDIETLLKNKRLPINLREKLVAMLGQKEDQHKNKEVVMDDETIVRLSGMTDLNKKKEAVLDFLITKCFDKKEGVMEYGENGTHYYLTLPSVNGSECKNLDWFVSERKVTEEEYVKNEEWKSNSSTIQEISTNFLGNIRDFLGKLNIKEYMDLGFTKELIYGCFAGNSVNKVTGLKDWYWLKDAKGDLRAKWYNSSDDCYYIRYDRVNEANLFLGLSIS